MSVAPQGAWFMFGTRVPALTRGATDMPPLSGLRISTLLYAESRLLLFTPRLF